MASAAARCLTAWTPSCSYTRSPTRSSSRTGRHPPGSGASSCTESFVMSRTLAEGPKLFTFDALTCEALENFDLSVSTADHLQPFPSVVIELPADYTRKRAVPFEEGSHAPDFVVVLIGDMKSTVEVKVEHRLQVAFYNLMLERLFEK